MMPALASRNIGSMARRTFTRPMARRTFTRPANLLYITRSFASVGDDIPNRDVFLAGGSKVNSDELFKGKTTVLVGYVGAFTGVCQKQLPAFSASNAQFKEKGVDNVVAVSVNDPVVLDAFAKAHNIDQDNVKLVADFDASFTKALGMDVDISAKGLGVRSKRYAIVAKDGKIVSIDEEESPGHLEVSTANAVLGRL